MELFAEDISTLEKDIDDLRNKLLRAKSITEYRAIVFQLDSLIDLYTYLTGDKSYKRKIRKNKNNLRSVDGYIHKIEEKYIDNFIDYKNLHKKNCAEIVSRYEEVSEKIEDYYINEEEVPIEEIIDVITVFLKGYNKGYENIFNKLISEKRIYLVKDIIDNDGESYICSIGEIFLIIISHDKIKNTIHLMTTIVHEIGHIIDHLQSNDSLKKENEYYANTFYGEVFSRFFEKEFLEYLINNRKEVEGLAKDELEAMYFALATDAEGVAITSAMTDEQIRTDSYKYLSYEYVKKLVDNENLPIDMDTYMEDIAPLHEFNLFDSNLYVYGGLIASYLSHLRKNDKEKFERIYNNFVRISRHNFSEELFEVLEITPDKLIDTLFEEIKILEDNEKVKTKKD